MIYQRFISSNNLNAALQLTRRIERNLKANVLLFKPRAEQNAPAKTPCEGGVCSLNWRPDRPAA